MNVGKNVTHVEELEPQDVHFYFALRSMISLFPDLGSWYFFSWYIFIQRAFEPPRAEVQNRELHKYTGMYITRALLISSWKILWGLCLKEGS